MKRPGGRPAKAVGASATAAVIAGAVLWPTNANASVTFEGFASALASQVTIGNQSIPVGLVIEGDGPLTRSRLNTIGDSEGLAAFPYPGDVAAGFPGIAGALAGFPTPAYPFYLSTSYGDAPKDLNYLGISLQSQSGATQTSSKAVAGSDTLGSTALSRVEQERSGSVQAVARATADGVVFGDKFRVSGMKSFTGVIADGFSGKRTTTTSLSFSELSAPGLELVVPNATPSTFPAPNPIPGLPQPPPPEFPPIPLVFGGQTFAAPKIGFIDGSFFVVLPGAPEQKYALPADSAIAAFKAAGINLEYQKPKPIDTGMIGGALRVSFQIPSPPPNQYFSGPTDIAVVLGETTASVDLNPATGDPVLSTDGDVGNAGGGPAAAGSPLGGVDSISGTVLIPGTDPTLGVLPTASGLGTIAGASPAPDGDVASDDALALVGLMGNQESGDVTGMYLLLVSMAAVGFAAATVLRLFGVRFLWKS